MEEPDLRDDLQRRRAGGNEPRRARDGDLRGRGGRSAERGEQHHDHRDDRDGDEHGEAA